MIEPDATRDIANFLKTIYLGDRACKGVLIDGWENTVSIEVDCVSRIRSQNGQWQFYVDEDIKDCMIVFGGVARLFYSSDGFLPDGEIRIRISGGKKDIAQLEISIGAVDEATALMHEVRVSIECRTVWLEDPQRPGVRIVD